MSMLNGCFRRGSSSLPPVKDLAMVRGDTKSFPVRGRSVPVGRSVTALYWTAKQSPSDADSAIVLQKTVTLTSGAAPVAAGTLDFAESDTTDSVAVPALLDWQLVAVLDDDSADTIMTGTLALTARIPIAIASGGAGAASGALSVLVTPTRASRDVPELPAIRWALRAALPTSTLAQRYARITHRMTGTPSLSGYTTDAQYIDLTVSDLTAPQRATLVAQLRARRLSITPGLTATLTLSPSAPSLVGTAGATQSLMVTATDGDGLVVPGATVALASADLTVCTVSPATAVTDYRGIATFTITLVGYGTSLLTATVGAVTGTATATCASGAFTEDFNRGNNALTLGASYTAHRGTWGVSGNQGYVPAPHASDYSNVSRASRSGAISNKVTVAAGVAGAPGVTIREIGTGNQHVKLEYQGSGANQFVISTRNGAIGTEAVIASGTVALNPGDTIEIREDGAGNISGYVNNVLKVGPVTTAIGAGNARCGLSSYNSTSVRFDDWTVS